MTKLSLAQLHAIYCVYRDLDQKTRKVRCCTCGKSITIDFYTDCYAVYGHYIPRSIEPKLKFHPLNAFPQCTNCNLQESKDIDMAYDNYMQYRFGNNIKEQLLNSDKETEDYYKEFYVNEILKLSKRFSELLDVVVDTSTGELYDVTDSDEIEQNNIQLQLNTYSETYKQDLDDLCKAVNCNQYVEYQRI